MTTIGLQKLGFGVCLGKDEDFPDIEIIHDAFLGIGGIESVDGPHINGTIGVTVWSNAYKSIEDARSEVVRAAKSLGLAVIE